MNIMPEHGRGTGGVPVAVMQDAIERTGMSLPDIARALDWTTTKPDTCRLKRTLGLRRRACRTKSAPVYSEYVSYDVAVRICDAAGIDPHLVGV